MIDLTRKNSLPNTVRVGGRDFPIFTDFRAWIKFEISLVKMDPYGQVNVEYLFTGEKPQYCSIEELLEFSRPKNELPRDVFRNSGNPIIDFELDSDLIYSAFLGQYGIDLVSVDYLHWHQFLALLAGLNESTKLREVIGYRCYEKTDEKEEVMRNKLKRAWEIVRTSPAEQAEIDEFNKLFQK